MEQMISFGDKVDFKMKQIHTKHTCCYDNLCTVSLLTHCGLGQYWLGLWLVARQHQAITGTNVDCLVKKIPMNKFQLKIKKDKMLAILFHNVLTDRSESFLM